MSRAARQLDSARIALKYRAVRGEIDLDANTFERPIFCDLLPVLAAVLEEVAPLLASWARDRVPWWIRWAVGGIVARAVVEGATDALEDYREDYCTLEEEPTE